MFGLGWPEVLALVVIALLVFGPEKLPQADLRANLGPEFADFDPADLNPKRFVRKHLIDDLEEEWQRSPVRIDDPVPFGDTFDPVGGELGYGEIPPYDTEAT